MPSRRSRRSRTLILEWFVKSRLRNNRNPGRRLAVRRGNQLATSRVGSTEREFTTEVTEFTENLKIVCLSLFSVCSVVKIRFLRGDVTRRAFRRRRRLSILGRRDSGVERGMTFRQRSEQTWRTRSLFLVQQLSGRHPLAQ